jgi:DNA-binding transcriptional MocR family regulator
MSLEGRLLGVPSDGGGMRVDVLSDRLQAGDRPAVVCVVAHFDNPTGATLTTERRRALAGLADRYGFIIVDDTAYRRLRYRQRRVRGRGPRGPARGARPLVLCRPRASHPAALAAG